METNGIPTDELQSLREENERLRKENEQLQKERDVYYRCVMDWAKQYFASQPLPPLPPEGEWDDFGKVIEELNKETMEK
jgi:hypothetical protein